MKTYESCLTKDDYFAFVRALSTLDSDGNFRTVMDVLRTRLADVDRTLRAQADDVSLRQLQGVAQELDLLIREAEGAREKARNIQVDRQRAASRQTPPAKDWS